MNETELDPVSAIILDELRSFRKDTNERLDKLVTADAFAAEQRRQDDKHASLGQEIVNERQARVLAITELKAANARVAANVKWAFAAIIIPSAGVVTTIIYMFRGKTG